MGLNQTAVQVLELCDGERTPEDIAAELQRYSGADVHDDVRELLGGDRRARNGGRCRRLGPTRSIAELTYQCPLHCPYCSNPIDIGAEHTATSSRPRTGCASSARPAARRPSARADRRRADGAQGLDKLVAAAREAGLYSTLVTAGHAVHARARDALKEAGLDQVQVSIQDSDPEESDRIAGTRVREEDRGRGAGARARVPADDQLRPPPPEPRPDRVDHRARRGARRPAARAREHAVPRLGGVNRTR